jgi:hypothetical protein
MCTTVVVIALAAEYAERRVGADRHPFGVRRIVRSVPVRVPDRAIEHHVPVVPQATWIAGCMPA